MSRGSLFGKVTHLTGVTSLSSCQLLWEISTIPSRTP